MIFGIWRKRRQEQDDELLSAYIDRRLDGEPGAELPERLRAEAEELAETAALLRSVERARAPRSFELSAVPVRSPSSSAFPGRTGWSLALFRAPAIAAAAAALVLGLLVIGNLAGILEQDGDGLFSGSASSEVSQASAAPPRSAPTAAPAAAAAPAATAASAATAAPAAASASAATAAPAATAASAATDAPAAAAPAATTIPAPASATSGDTALAAPPSTEAAAAPESGAGLAESALPAPTEPLDTEGADEAAELPLRSGGGLPPDEDLERQPDGETSAPATRELFQPGVVLEDDDGIALPLWQFELAFGLLALALGGAAFAFRLRR